MNSMKQPAPPYTMLPTHPYKPCLTHYMIFRYKTPVTAVLRLMPVIPHHPVIIHFKSIGICRLAINKYFAILFFPLVVFIYFDGPLVQGNISTGKFDGISFAGHP